MKAFADCVCERLQIRTVDIRCICQLREPVYKPVFHFILLTRSKVVVGPSLLLLSRRFDVQRNLEEKVVYALGFPSITSNVLDLP